MLTKKTALSRYSRDLRLHQILHQEAGADGVEELNRLCLGPQGEHVVCTVRDVGNDQILSESQTFLREFLQAKD